jgi:hypothetical protein
VLPELSFWSMLTAGVTSVALPLGCYVFILIFTQQRIRLGRDYNDNPSCGSYASLNSPDTPGIIIASTLALACISTIERYYVLGLYVGSYFGPSRIVWVQPLYALGSLELAAILCIGARIKGYWMSSHTSSLEVGLIGELDEKRELHARVSL